MGCKDSLAKMYELQGKGMGILGGSKETWMGFLQMCQPCNYFIPELNTFNHWKQNDSNWIHFTLMK